MIPVSPKGFLAPDAYQLRSPICVIPCGGLLDDAAFDWTAEKLLPYAKYVVNGQPIDDLFKGFVFNGIRSRNSHYMYPLYVGFGEPSDMTDWTMWIDQLFQPEVNLDALSSVLSNEMRDVWISIPYPHPFQRSFGIVQGRNLDFQLEEDRLAAVDWWINQFVSAWTSHPAMHAKLQLRGFLWQREAIDVNDESLVKQVNAAVQSHGYLSMWLPNYGSYGVLEWDKLGFHIAALNCNYYGNTSYDHNWIKNASLFARYYHTGMQIIWGKGLIYNDSHLLDFMNLGLPDKSGYMADSLLVHQFPNQRLDLLQQTNFTDYIRLYLFVKKLYGHISYPGIPY